jgi:hypothetical protein
MGEWGDASQTRQYWHFKSGKRFKLLLALNVYAPLLAGQPAAETAVPASSTVTFI